MDGGEFVAIGLRVPISRTMFGTVSKKFPAIMKIMSMNYSVHVTISELFFAAPIHAG